MAAVCSAIRQAETMAFTQEIKTTSGSAAIEGILHKAGEQTTSSTFAGHINPITTIALLTDNASIEATYANVDMRLIVQALRADTEIQKQDLKEKRFFKPW